MHGWLNLMPAYRMAACWSVALVGMGCGSDGMGNPEQAVAQTPPQASAPPPVAGGGEPMAGMGGSPAPTTATGPSEPAQPTFGQGMANPAAVPGSDAAPAGPGAPTEPGDAPPQGPAAPGNDMMAGMMGDDGQMIPPLADGMFPDPRGGCDLDTNFPGDDACMLPPPEGEGMQIHVGPEDYDNPGEYEFAPGRENSECVNFVTPNVEDVYYQGWVLSGRPGTHHIINTMYATPNPSGGTTFKACRDGGTGTGANIIANLPGASKPYMPRAPVAPENAGVGAKIPANTHAQADMHYFNPTEKPLLREFWLNIYFVPKDQVTQESTGIRAMGGLSWTVAPIPPGTDKTYSYECPITSPGRITQLLGHYHAHGVHFTSHLRRASGERVKVFEMYDYQDPAIFYYNSVTENPGFSDSAAGATSGMLEVDVGDVIEWECHIVNDSAFSLTYTNQVDRGEMCNLWGAAIGPKIDCVVF